MTEQFWQSDNLVQMHIELTNLCNAACPMCVRFHRNSPLPRPDLEFGQITLDKFKTYFPPDIIQKCDLILFCGVHGDPCVAKDMYEICEYIYECSETTAVRVNTNGGMRKSEWWTKLGALFSTRKRGTQYNFWEIIFSIDGLEDTNHLYRRNVVWKSLMENVSAFINAGGGASWDYLIFKHNEHQIAEASQLSEKIGFTEFIPKKALGVDFEENGKQTLTIMPVLNKEGELDYTIEAPVNPQNRNMKDPAGTLPLVYWPFKTDEYRRMRDDKDSLRFNYNKEVDSVYDIINKTSFTEQDSCGITCKSITPSGKKEIFVDNFGRVMPCCYIGTHLNGRYNDTASYQLLNHMNAYGWDHFSLDLHSLSDILDSGHLDRVFADSWTKDSVKNGKLAYCANTCGRKSNIDKIFSHEINDKATKMEDYRKSLQTAEPPYKEPIVKKPAGFGKLFKLRVANPKARSSDEFDDKHTKMMAAILPYAKSNPQKNLSGVVTGDVIRKTSVMFMLMPQWAKLFAPYNVARLAAMTKAAGYKTYAVDLNAKAAKDLVNWPIDYDPWSGSRDWKWLGETYHNEIHPHLLPLLQKYLDDIAEKKPAVIGFTLYYCNEEPTKWMAQEIKKRFPDIILMVGGPQCHQSYWTPIPEFDYIVSGEGEKMILEILEEIESGNRPTEQQWARQEEGERLNLDSLPRPDYSYFDPAEYGMPNGINAELSRGCVAKCVFCSETHFWKFRGRQATSIIEEVSELYHTRGVDVIWFLDSLVNGNLNELRAFAKGIVASGIKMHWTGYARCDGRMDSEYFQDLADSGCLSLSYGIESGSDKVLSSMNKGVTVKEIEQNLRDGSSVGIEAFTNWIVGFPTEDHQDFYETLALIWRNRNNKITDIAGGHGFTIPPDTIVGQASEDYGIIKAYYLNNWINEDFTNSKIHRLIRVKSFNMFLHFLIDRVGISCSGTRPTIASFYTLNTRITEFKDIEFEQFAFDIIKTGDKFADSLMNEIWPLLRIFWKTIGAYDIEIIYDPVKDLQEFSDRLVANYTAKYIFSIDDQGNWSADFAFDYKQDDNAWRYSDYSRADSVAASRARQLADPKSGGKVTWTIEKYKKHMVLLDDLVNRDFSFTHQYSDTGKW